MALDVLLSALLIENENYVDTLGITGNAVVVNQCNSDIKRTITRLNSFGNEQKVKYIETKERGLSKSRNMAIANSDADICILCDNDVEYVQDYENIITDAFNRHLEADILVFYIKRKERPEPIFKNDKRMGYLSVLKIFSPEIAFRRKSIEELSFDENFGAGAKYIMGEENIFLYDCLKKHKRIVYIPQKIAQLREEESTWFKGYNERFFISRGANYAAMSRPWSIFLIVQFAIRKTSLYKDNMSVGKALSYMFKGRKEYLSRG